MATKNTRIKASVKKGVTTVKAMATHPMMSYDEAKRAKKEANFITHITAKVGGEVVFEVSTSQFLSKNPYLKFSFNGGEKGQEVEIAWVDLKGETNTSTGKIK
jgi:sulfur-oxidizing protein SoxZ